jgi:Raf kinase inhibitor-like YbhB/YbcL family protein
MKITSPVFQENAVIPGEYTCDGADQSPPLSWKEAPLHTAAFALIVDDPDAPGGTFVHWVLYNIPGSSTMLEKNQPHDKELDNGALQGINDFKNIGYGGPCPPEGSHRYFFKLYALDERLQLKEGATKGELLSAMKGHVLAESQIVAIYERDEIRVRARMQETSRREQDKTVDEAAKESFPASDAPAWNP